MNKTREQMNVVVVGHVDHGKSTVIGRLLADTDSLPKGKLDQVRATCERNARPFEYAFLLDALKDEQAQGITIDTARCFFKTQKRDYIIIDAPGHVEFLKNMVSGAARAEAALLVIDAHEGIQENSKRHGYLISMLGIPQLVVLVNKMDLVNYDKNVFDSVTSQYRSFLQNLGVTQVSFIPISARNGENLAFRSDKTAWYTSGTVLEHIDGFTKRDDDHSKPFRMPVQDIYKFTAAGDDRRIFAGTIETGQISTGDKVIFLPSGKKSTIVTIEGFNQPQKKSIGNGYATGFTLKDELYIQRGEVMCREDQRLPLSGTSFKANIFWMGRNPMVLNKKYKLKIASARASVRLVDVITNIDASDLSSSNGKKQIDRHDVAECILETTRPVAFDTIDDIQSLGRFVIVDGYDIAGGGIITAANKGETSIINDGIKQREFHWDTGFVTKQDRQKLFGHASKFIIITGDENADIVAKALENKLIKSGKAAYYLGLTSLKDGLSSDVPDGSNDREELIRRIGELARIMTDAGLLFITSINFADEYDFDILSKLTRPYEFLHISLDDRIGNDQNHKIILSGSRDIEAAIEKIVEELQNKEIFTDFNI
jgi:bifunctional enzyme CysN/CysC